MWFSLDRNNCNYHNCNCMGQASRDDYHFNRVTKESSKFFFQRCAGDTGPTALKSGCGGVLPICPPEKVQVLPMASQSENNFNSLHSQSLPWPWDFSPYVNVYDIFMNFQFVHVS